MWYFIALRKIYLSIPIIEFLTSNSDEVGTSNHHIEDNQDNLTVPWWRGDSLLNTKT